MDVLHMQMRQKGYLKEHHYCELTSELDDLAGIEDTSLFHHYVLVDDWCRQEMAYAIRVPGGTVGSLKFDDNGVVTNIIIDTKYVVKTYPKDINETVKKYIGYKIEFSDKIECEE